MIELFAGSSWAGQYLWPPGWLVHTQLERRDNRRTLENCHLSSGFKRKSVWLLPLKEDSRCRRWSRLHIPWGSRVLLMCACAGMCVYSWWCVRPFMFFFQKSDLLEEKAEKKLKEGKPSWASVTYLVTPAGYCSSGCLGRSVGGGGKKTKQRREVEKLNVRQKLQNYSLICYFISLPLAFFPVINSTPLWDQKGRKITSVCGRNKTWQEVV